MLEYFWIIPMPLLITLIITFIIGNRLGAKMAWLGVIGAFSSLILALSFLPQVFNGVSREIEFTWFLDIKLGFILDPLTIILLIVVSILVTLITLYAYGYMHEEEGQLRFYCFLQLFSFSMLGLVISNNLLQAFIFWELMGLCSYALIGFWFFKPSAAAAGKKAFLTTRVGDVIMLVGILIIYTQLGTFRYTEIFDAVAQGQLSQGWITLATLCIFGGVVGKSAQFPLHVWLPDAMEGPTPVSALIHAATMVKAGVFMVARLYPLFKLAPVTLETMAVIGAITVLGAALMAIVAQEFKQILAFSTLSQLGYMVVALGALGSVASVLHLVNHAFFKALLFLGAGSAIHGVGTNNVWQMGGLYKYQKITALTILMATLSISGVPPFSGFWSKDEILMAAYHNANPIIFWVLAVTSLITAFYMFRLYYLVFTGKPRSDYHAHEPVWSMLVPLVILSVFAVFSGFAKNPISMLLTGEHIEHGSPIVMYISIAMVAGGILLSTLIYYWNVVSPHKIAEKLRPLYTLLFRRYYIDDLYNAFCRVVVVGCARIADFFDRKIIDGIIHIFRDLTLLSSGGSKAVDTNIVDGAINGLCAVVVSSGSQMRKLSTGRIQQYLLVAILGITSILLVILGGIL